MRASAHLVALLGAASAVVPPLAGRQLPAAPLLRQRTALRSRVLTASTPAAQPAPVSDGVPSGVVTVLTAAFLNLLGFTMAIPINTALKGHFGLSMGSSLGSLSSAYPLGMFGALFLWPRLSDRVGRKPVISLSLLGSAIGLAAQAYAVHRSWPLTAFLTCRVLTGCCAGAGTVAKAYLADIGAASGRLPQYMAWRDAANTLAFIAGPILGGYVYAATNSLATVIGVMAFGSLAAAALVARFVTEAGWSERGGGERALRDEEVASASSGERLACPLGTQLYAAVGTVCAISALYNCGSATFSAFLGPLAQERAGLSVRSVGTAYTLLSALSFAVSTTVAARAQRVLGVAATCTLGLLFVGLGLLGMGAVAALAPASAATFGPGYALAFWGAAALYQLGVPLYAPTVPTMLLQCVPPRRRGALMGLDEAFNTAARVAAPIYFGSLYASRGAFACLGAAGAASIAAAALTVARRLLTLRSVRRLERDL